MRDSPAGRTRALKDGARGAITKGEMHSAYASQSHERLRQDAVLSATPQQLVVLLYDAAVRFGRQAQVLIEQGDQPGSFAKLGRVEAILDELLATLDHEAGGELAGRLQALYVWCRRCLVEARVERSVAKIAHVVSVVSELRDAFATAAQTVAPPPVPA